MDLGLLLNDYVKRESDEEKSFVNEQKQSNVKLYISVSHSNCLSKNDCPDLLMVHAKITQNIERKDNFFFIKSMKISHCTGVFQTDSNDNNKIMSIEIAITKDLNQCETIFKAYVNRDQDGERNKFQMSYTRQIIKCHHPDRNNSEIDEYSTIFSDNENDGSEKCLKINSQMNSEPNSIRKTKIFKKSNIKDDSYIKKKKVFLGPLRKPKSLPIDNFVPKIELDKVVTSTLGTRKMSLSRIFSMKNEILEKKKPTNILATISVKEKKENYEFIEDDMSFMDEENDGDNTDVLASDNIRDFFVRFDFCSVNDEEQQKYNIIESVECTCNERRISEMSNLLLLSMDKKNSPLVNYNEINKFDNKCGHYLDCCQLSSSDSSGYLNPISPNSRNISLSFNSVFFPNPLNNVSNNQLSPGFELSKSKKSSFCGSVEHVDKCLKELKTIEEVHCSLNHVNFFKNVKTYEKYDNTMRQILGNSASFNNFVVFLYSIRVIIQQIDHPCNSRNEDINKIYAFSKQFINEFFGSEVQRRGGLDNFIFRRDDID